MLTLVSLRHRADFVRLRRAAKRVSPFFVMRFAPTPEASLRDGQVRVGYTVTRACGNAVRRNRIKRRLRALVREGFPQHAVPGHDYVLIALDHAAARTATAPFDELRQAMRRMLLP